MTTIGEKAFYQTGMDSVFEILCVKKRGGTKVGDRGGVQMFFELFPIFSFFVSS